MIAPLLFLNLALAGEPVATDAAPAPTVASPSEATPKAPAWTEASPHKAAHRWGDAWQFDASGQLRYLLSTPPDVAVNADGGTTGQRTVLDQRLRVGLGLQWQTLRLATEWDLFSGQVAGDTWDIAGTTDTRRRDAKLAFTGHGFIPRRLSLGFSTTDGIQFEAGVVPGNWGLGIVANGGNSETLFGRVDRGDRMMRFRTTFAPISKGGQRLPLFFTVAFDQVVEDDLARWNEQRAYQIVASALWADPNQRRLGLFYTFRTQTEPGVAARPTLANVIDLYADAPFALGKSGWKLRLAGEVATIFGRTEKILSFATPDATKISSAAGVLEAEVHAPKDLVAFHLHTGASSSTGDPDAGVLHDFTLDSNYNVGLVLFDEVMGSIEAATYAQLADPANSGSVPLGADLLVSEGSVRRATWLQPAVVVRPNSWIDLRVGGVFGWSTGPVSQAFYTFRAGGVPHNQLNQATSGHWLGGELDWAVAFGRGPGTAPWWLRPRLQIEGGHAFLGKNLGGGVASTIMATARVDW